MTDMKFRILNKLFPAVAIICIIVLASCTEKPVFQKYKKIENKNWKFDYRIPFNFMISDTNALYNVYFNIRTSGLYPYSNIWINLKKFDPAGKLMQEMKVEFKLADRNGRWYGKGLGDIIDNQLLLEEHIKFSQKGEYTYYINHEMRDEELPFIMDVGLSVIKTRSKGKPF